MQRDYSKPYINSDNKHLLNEWGAKLLKVSNNYSSTFTEYAALFNLERDRFFDKMLYEGITEEDFNKCIEYAKTHKHYLKGKELNTEGCYDMLRASLKSSVDEYCDVFRRRYKEDKKLPEMEGMRRKLRSLLYWDDTILDAETLITELDRRLIEEIEQ